MSGRRRLKSNNRRLGNVSPARFESNWAKYRQRQFNRIECDLVFADSEGCGSGSRLHKGDFRLSL